MFSWGPPVPRVGDRDTVVLQKVGALSRDPPLGSLYTVWGHPWPVFLNRWGDPPGRTREQSGRDALLRGGRQRVNKWEPGGAIT